MTLHWTIYLLISNFAIAFVEYVYRVGQYESFFKALPYIIVPILIGQWGLYGGFGRAENLLMAGAVFSLINIIFRLCVTHYIGETLNWVNWLGIALLASSVVLLKVKL